jgi:hypothetical protein
VRPLVPPHVLLTSPPADPRTQAHGAASVLHTARAAGVRPPSPPPVVVAAADAPRRRYPEFGEMVGARLAALRETFGKECVTDSALCASPSRVLVRYVSILAGILSEDQAGKGLSLKDLEKLSKMVRGCVLRALLCDL